MATTFKIDSNFTGLSYAEEVSIGTLPVSPVFYDQEPNEYNDFGGTLSTVARTPIEPSRQRKKGTVTDLEVAGGFSTDLTKTNLQKMLQAFVFADARELKTTKPLNGAQVLITGADASDSSFTAAAGLSVFAAGELVHVDGFVSATDNGLKTVVSSASGKLTVAGSLVTESGASAVVIQKVGMQLAAGDAQITKDGDIYGIELTAGTFSGVDGIAVGAWMYVGGDTVASQFSENVGYVRIATVSAKKLTFDGMVTGLTAADDGAGKSIQIFFGTMMRNEKNPSLIKTRSFTFERTLGTTDMGEQAEYIFGAVANELTLNVPTAEKVTVDLGFVATDYQVRSGAAGDEKISGVHIPAAGEECYNTSSNIPLVAITSYDRTRSQQKELFTYCENFMVKINNNVSVDKAVGVLGGFDVSIGNFDVDVTSDAYFAYVEALRAIRKNADVGATVVVAQKNYGMIWDVPLGTVGGGNLDVAAGSSVKTSLEFAGAENKAGYTLMIQSFAYLPNAAM